VLTRAGVGLSGAHRGLVLSIYYTARCSGLPSVPTSFNRLARAHVGLPDFAMTICSRVTLRLASCYSDATKPLDFPAAICHKSKPTWYACDTVQFHLLGSDPVEEESDMDTPSIWPPTYCLAEDFVSEFPTKYHRSQQTRRDLLRILQKHSQASLPSDLEQQYRIVLYVNPSQRRCFSYLSSA
jgi:hypothetical protein